MIKANVILDYSKWKNKIKNPKDYIKKRLKKFSKIPNFQTKKHGAPNKWCTKIVFGAPKTWCTDH